MTRLFAVSFMLLFSLGCVKQGETQASIDLDAIIESGNVSLLESYKNDPYITHSTQVQPPGNIKFSNAMESAIYKRNIEVVRYLIGINAAHKVSVRYLHNNEWARTPITVPAAELACGVGAFDIMELLLQSYPEDKPNYTNCLHYLVASYEYYPSRIFFASDTTPFAQWSQWRNGENTALAAEKIIALGGDPNALPEYDSTLHSKVFRSFTNKLLITLLENGMDPNQPYPCGESGHCLMLADLGMYNNQNISSERARLLVENGADLNAVIQTPVLTSLDQWGIGQFKNQSMTALHTSEYYDRDQLSETLIELGADPTLTNNDGKTASNFAGSIARIKARQAAATQQAATANTNQDSDGIGASTLFGIISGAVGIMDVQ